MKTTMKKKVIISLIENAAIIFLLGIASSTPFSNAYGQQAENEQYLWQRESFGHLQMNQEDVSRRSMYAKHFRNANGKMIAVVGSGPVNYLEDGSWKTIYHGINANSTGFENTTNRHKTYYPKSSTGSITTILPEGETLKDMKGMRMYYQGNGQEIRIISIKDKKGQANWNELVYPDVYGDGIDLKLTQNTTSRKMDYIIRDQAALGTIPSTAQFLVFEEKVELPSGWTASAIDDKIALKTSNGAVMALFDRPFFYDTPEHHHDAAGNHVHETPNERNGHYEFTQNGNLLTIKTLVPVNWLNQELSYPLIIDPTISLYPANLARWTGHHRTTSNNTCYTSGCGNYTSTNITESVENNFWIGRYDTDKVYNGWVKFDITAIPDDACVNSAILQYNVFDNNTASSGCVVMTRFRHMATDPSVNDFSVGANNQTRLTDIRDGDIYGDFNTAVLVSGTGWHSVNLNANMNHLQSQLVPNWFAVGLNTHGGANNHLTCRNNIRGYSHANKPVLIVHYDPPTQDENITICSGELPYTWYGQTITTGGTGVATHMTQGTNGCDLQLTLNLTVNPGTPAQTEDITICSSDLPYTWNGQTITAGGNGVATRTNQDANGCNYVTTLNLTVHPGTTPQTDNISICSNQLPYTWHGQTITAGGTNVATHTTQDANGCNVTTTLNLTVDSEINTTDDITICQSDLPYTWHGQTIATGGNGVATHAAPNGNGCNTITTLNLNVIPETATTQTLTICQSDLPYTWNGQVITAGGTGVATHATQDANGCTSTVTLNLTVIPETSTTQNIAICQSDLPYIWNGQTITAGGNNVATHTSQDANGCNSTTVLNLTVHPETTTSETITICQNALPYTWHGQTITAGGNNVATHTSQDANGCNLITTLNLVVSPQIQQTENISICSSALPYTWNGQVLTTGGTGVATHTTQDPNGCTVITTLNLTITPVPDVSFTATYEPCIPSDVAVTPTAVLPGLQYSWLLDGSVISTNSSGFNLNVTNPGCHDVTLVVTTSNGCSSSSVQQPAFCIDAPPTANFTYTGEGSAETSGQVQTHNLSSHAASYNWVVSNGAASSETSPLLQLGNSGNGTYTITLYAYSANGCVDSISKVITVKEDMIFYVPNTFTPDHDEYNNSFGPVITAGIDLYSYTFTIYNRWGELIFESHDVSVHWDGTYNGKMVQDGAYTWQLKFKEIQTDAYHRYTGHINLIR